MKLISNAQSCVLMFLIFNLFMPSQTFAHPRLANQGVYTGIGVSSQNVFSGGFLNDVDVLEQESLLVSELLLGWKMPISSNWFVALEANVGIINDTLSLQEPGLSITYDNQSHYSFGGHLARYLNQQHTSALLFYANITHRSFDLSISIPDHFFTQKDQQSFLRYGLGYQKAISKNWQWRATIGGNYVSFGELETNINVNDGFDIGLALTYSIQ